MVAFALLLSLMGASDPDRVLPPADIDFFERKIRPVLVEKCYRCHNVPEGVSLKGGLSLASPAGMLRGGGRGPAIRPGDSEGSLLVKAIRYEDDRLKMPPAGRLPAEVVKDFEAWIRRGAPDPRAAPDPPAGAAGAAAPPPKGIDLEKGRLHWAFQPLAAPAPPPVRDESWVRTPVDRFILARLEEKGIAPNPAVDRRRLIRRAHFDLLGLPPPAAEVEAFVNDPDPQAHEKLIDRLLASDRLGERWARVWLDVTRFAESHGFEQDYDRENAYHFRDFAIRALNQDMPYDQFVRWQVAGDEVAPGEPLAWMATGFLGAGPFPTQLTETEFESARYDELDNMVSTLGSAMLGLSIGCARCHDHKYDPIPSQDYYRLASTFTTAIRSHVDLDLDPETTRRELAAWEKEHAPLAAALADFERKALPARFEAWAASRPWESLPPAAWIVLDLAGAKSKGGAAFQPRADGSALVAGSNPDEDRWTITVRTSFPSITALRVEALADPSLKKNGPGRADNGNFALSDLRITARPAGADGAAAQASGVAGTAGGSGSGNAGPGEPAARGPGVQVKLVSAKATFEQNAGNLSAAAAIDGDPKSGWAVDPQFGKDHAAVFAFAEPVGFAGGTELVIDLEFRTNARHAIGRPRLSVAVASPPPGLEGEARPQALAELLDRLRQRMCRSRLGRGTPPGGRRAGGAHDAAAVAAYKSIDPEWRKLNDAVAEHLARKPEPRLTRILATTEGLKPLPHHADGRGFPHFYRETHFLARGDAGRKQGVAAPGFLRALVRAPGDESRWEARPPAGARTSFRRAALGEWLTDVEAGAGSLLARVIVNRLWQQHLGRGIVATPNDFGLQGEPPTHPELLDWLAGELVRGGWRLKAIHRLILLSSVYLETGDADPSRARLDPDNRLFWRRELRRLDAEAIRDAMLAASGLLDERMFGPGTLEEDMTRRSVYFSVKRSRLIPMMQVFDAPEALVSIGARPTTTIAPQALLFLNSPRVRKYAAAFARRLPAGAAPAEAAAAAYRIALGREPSAEEAQAAAAFLGEQIESYRRAGREEARELALADFCQILMSTSEFIYVD